MDVFSFKYKIKKYLELYASNKNFFDRQFFRRGGQYSDRPLAFLLLQRPTEITNIKRAEAGLQPQHRQQSTRLRNQPCACSKADIIDEPSF
jgi:hypothetical protein